MPWQPTDKKQIWTWLNLPREMLIPNSDLSVAMTQVEEFDNEYQTGLVEDAQAILQELDELRPLIEEERAKAKLKKSSSYLEGEDEYFNGNDALNALFATRDNLIQRLRRILDMDSLMSCFGIGDLIQSS
jgi:hypothetical protein